MVVVEQFEGDADLAENVGSVNHMGEKVGETNIDPCSLGLCCIQSRIAKGQDECID